MAAHPDPFAPREEYEAHDQHGDELRGSIRHLPEEPHPPVGSTPQTRPGAPPALAHDREERQNARLVSASTDASVASSFQSLATSMFLRDPDMIARTAREMLRPMLKQWLDDNLPVMVERLVRAEIERVARGGR